jgi:hypothetical protein
MIHMLWPLDTIMLIYHASYCPYSVLLEGVNPKISWRMCMKE